MLKEVAQADVDAVHTYNRVLDHIADEVVRSRLMSFRDTHLEHIADHANDKERTIPWFARHPMVEGRNRDGKHCGSKVHPGNSSVVQALVVGECLDELMQDRRPCPAGGRGCEQTRGSIHRRGHRHQQHPPPRKNAALLPQRGHRRPPGPGDPGRAHRRLNTGGRRLSVGICGNFLAPIRCKTHFRAAPDAKQSGWVQTGIQSPIWANSQGERSWWTRSRPCGMENRCSPPTGYRRRKREPRDHAAPNVRLFSC